jgi:hypothetical protein
MDDRCFDRLTKQLAATLSRRGLIKAIAVTAALQVSAHARQAEAKRTKTRICHQTGSSSNPWVVIDVSTAAYDAHIAHGDQPYVDCCSSADCADGLACVSGTCQCEAPCGSMTCSGTGFLTFTCHGSTGSSCETVYRECAAGTVCRDAGNGTIVCDWPTP